MTSQDAGDVALRDLRQRGGTGGTPAIQGGFPALLGTVQQGPAQWQETQIVQS